MQNRPSLVEIERSSCCNGKVYQRYTDISIMMQLVKKGYKKFIDFTPFQYNSFCDTCKGPCKVLTEYVEK